MNKLRNLLIIFMMFLYANTLYAFSYDATYDGSHSLSQYTNYAKNLLYADNKIFYIYDSNVDSKIMYEDTNTGRITTVDMAPKSTLSSKNYTFYQMYNCTGGYIIILRSRFYYGWGMDYVIKYVSKDFKTTYFEYLTYQDNINCLTSDTSGNLYLLLEYEENAYVYKFSPSGSLLWKSSIPYGVINNYYVNLDSKENIILYVTSSYTINELYISKSSGSISTVSTTSLKNRIGEIHEANSDYIVYEKSIRTGEFYYVDRKSNTERKIEMGADTINDVKLFSLKDNNKVALKFYNSYLTIYHYDSHYNLTHSYSHNLNSYISGASLNRTGIITDENQIYIYPRLQSFGNITFIARVVLSKALPTVSSFSVYEFIGDNTNGILNISYDLKGNDDYTMKIYSVNTSDVYYVGKPLTTVNLNLIEGDHYLQVMLTNGKKSISSNIIHINKLNLLNRAYAVVSKGKEQYVVLDDANRYYEENTDNQQLVSKLKSASNGIFVISNDVSPVLVPLLEK